MGSSVRVPGVGQPHKRPGGTAVAQVKEVVGNLRPATSVVVQARKVAESLRPATSAVAGGKRALLVDLARAEASVLPVIRARRAAVLPHAVLAVREDRGAAVHRAAVEEDRLEEEDPLVEEDPLEVAEVVAGEQEQEIRNKRNSDED
jgi:hypothetical protein